MTPEVMERESVVREERQLGVPEREAKATTLDEHALKTVERSWTKPTANPLIVEPPADDPRKGFTLTLPIEQYRDDRSPRLRASYEAIARLRSASAEPADWIEAAATLKRDAVRLRNTYFARHASVLLAVADALTFTEPDDPTLDAGATAMFTDSLALLTEPFLSQPAEETFLLNLLGYGWNLGRPRATSQSRRDRGRPSPLLPGHKRPGQPERRQDGARPVQDHVAWTQARDIDAGGTRVEPDRLYDLCETT